MRPVTVRLAALLLLAGCGGSSAARTEARIDDPLPVAQNGNGEPTPTPPPAPAPAPVPAGPIDVLASIRRVSPTEVAIPRRALDAFVETELMQLPVQVVPEDRGGTTIGIRVLGIAPGSVLAAFGLEDGDVVRTVSGVPIVSPDGALEAYVRARAATVIPLEIERAGAPRTISIRVID